MSVIQTAASIDPWAWWRAALAEEDVRKREGLFVNEPAQGYYQLKWHGKWCPVAYWYEGDGLHCLVNDDWFHEDSDTHLKIAVEQWTRAAKLPISEETYNNALEGKTWLKLDPSVERGLEEDEARARATKMSNQPPAEETDEQRYKRLSAELKDQINNAIHDAKQYAEIDSDDMSARALTVVRWLQKLAREAETHKKAEVGDHYTIYKNALDRWNPIAGMAREATAAIERWMSAWENTKDRLKREQEAALERRRQEQLKREQAEADRQIAEGTPPSQMEVPTQPTFLEPEPPAAPPPRSQIRGAYGRAATVVMVKTGTIVDQDQVYQHFKGDADVIALLRKLVNREVKAGNTVPGVEITEERAVR